MKVGVLLLLCLFISGAVLGTLGPDAPMRSVNIDSKAKEGQTEDDFHEDTDVQRTQASSVREWSRTETDYNLREDEELFGVQRTEEEAPTTETFTRVTQVRLPNGQVVNKLTNETVSVTKSKVIKTVKKFWKKKVRVDSVKEVVNAFTELYGKELTDNQLTLFNTIAITDPIDFESKHTLIQTKMENLHDSLLVASRIFDPPLSQADLDNIEYNIRTCTTTPVAINIDTSLNEYYTSEEWKTKVGAVFATCGNGKHAVQIATWSASKQGTWSDPSYYSNPNVRTVDDIITQWLFRQLHLLFNCSGDDVPVAPNSSVPSEAILAISGSAYGKIYKEGEDSVPKYQGFD